MAAFYNSLMLSFPYMTLSYYPKDFGIVAFASINTGKVLFFKFRIIIIIIIIITNMASLVV